MNYCKRCRKPLTTGSFCPYCGYNQKELTPTPPPPQAITKKKGNPCSVLAIIFAIIGMIPLLNILFLPIAIILAIIGFSIRKNRKKGATILSILVVIISICIFANSTIPKLAGSNTSNNSSSQTEELIYEEISINSTIENEFVRITINEVSTATTLRSINSNAVLNADADKEYIYLKGTLTNLTATPYTLGALGSFSSSSNPLDPLDCILQLADGEEEYCTLLIDDGGFYGILSDGKIFPQETVTFYFVCTVERGHISYYKNSELLIGFTDGFKEDAKYDLSNCTYRYKITLEQLLQS